MEKPVLLILRALGLGDLLTGVPALRALANAFPEHERVLACPRALEPLALLSGAVDRVLPAAPLAPLQIAAGNPDLAVNLHGRGPQSHAVLLATNPGRLVAFSHPDVPETAGLPKWRPDEHEVARWCRLLEESGIPTDPDALDLPSPPLEAPAEAQGATLIHPGAASAARRWPAGRFAQIAAAELERGRSVVLTGGADERELAQRVAFQAGLDETAVYAGRTNPLELAALVAAAGRVVCGDTGVAHLATAFGTPSVVVFGPTSPAHWGPPADRPRHRSLWDGRTGDPHGAEPAAGLLALEVADVLAALAELDSPLTLRA